MIISRLRRGARPVLGAGLALCAALAIFTTSAQADFTFYTAAGVATTDTSESLLTMTSVSQGGLGYYLVVDDKTFNNFNGYVSTATGGASVVSAANITVTPILSSSSQPGSGPGIQYNSSFWTVTGGTAAVSQDTSFTYDVTVNGGAKILHDASLNVSGVTLGSPTSNITIGETLTSGPPSFTPVATPGVFAINVAPPGGNKLFDQPFFTPVNFVEVTKDISLSMTAGATGVTSFSVMQQRFSQVVPEPSSMAIAGLGALGMIGYGLRRRKALGA